MQSEAVARRLAKLPRAFCTFSLPTWRTMLTSLVQISVIWCSTGLLSFEQQLQVQLLSTDSASQSLSLVPLTVQVRSLVCGQQPSANEKR